MTTAATTPLGWIEVAELLGVKVKTVWTWGDRGQLPERDFTVNGKPAWKLSTIERWARKTGRL